MNGVSSVSAAVRWPRYLVNTACRVIEVAVSWRTAGEGKEYLLVHLWPPGNRRLGLTSTGSVFPESVEV
jgi:hypothetical protein